jgi:hypothetical protein
LLHGNRVTLRRRAPNRNSESQQCDENKEHEGYVAALTVELSPQVFLMSFTH